MNTVKLYQISLNKNETVHLPTQNGKTLFFKCSNGSAWLTTARDPHDYVIDNEHEVRLVGPHKDVLVQSLSEHVEIEVYACA